MLHHFPTSFKNAIGTKQPMLHLICSNSNSNLSTFPVYMLQYVNQNDSAYIEKVFSCDDDGIFSNVNPCILLLKDEHF